MKQFKIVLFSSALTLSVSQTDAQSLDIGEILVTPNRSASEKSKTGAKVETVTAGEIQQRAEPQVVDYLTRLPGVSVSQPGGAGQETSLSVRGADKKYVKTLFNGIDISDPTATQVQTSFEHLLSGGITGVEVLKGSQSTLYGADAVAGVIGISTLDDIPPGLSAEIRGEGGTFATARGGVGLKAAEGDSRVAFNLNGLRSEGISAADRRNGNREDDGYRNYSLDLAGEHRLSESISVFGAALAIRSEVEFDDNGNPPTDNDFNDTPITQLGGRVGINVDLFDGRLSNSFALQHFDINRNLELVSQFGPFDALYEGTRSKLEWQSAGALSEMVTLQIGADHEFQEAEVRDNFGTDTSDDITITGVWSQAIFEPSETATLTAGIRHDRHSTFDGFTTYRITGAWRPENAGTKLHGSFGTGFRAPSLYELFAPFGIGNENLDPEESTSFDLGIEQVLLDGTLLGDVTFFKLDTDNLIDFNNNTGAYEEVRGTTERQGVEVSLFYYPADWAELGAAYTYTDTEEPDGGRRPRIPRHDATLAATLTPIENWEFGATARAVIDTQDIVSPSFGNFVDVHLDDYLLVNAKVAYKPTPDYELYLRGSNLLDQDYQVIQGFGTPGIGAYAGARLQF